MSNCTQIFLVIIKGENQDIDSFKEYYLQGKPLLIHKGNHTDFSYNSNHSKEWMEQPKLFSFFIKKYWRTNKDYLYSIEKLAQKFPELEFHHVHIIHHGTSRDAKLSSEGYEILKKGSLYDSCQMARGAIDWGNIVYNGVPDTMFEYYLKLKYINQLLKHQDTNVDLISKIDTFKAIPKAGICEKPIASFNDIIDEKEFFNAHFDEISLVIQNQIRTKLIQGVKEGKYITASAELSLLNFALKPYITERIPELFDVLDKMIFDMDLIVERINNKELDPEIVLLSYNQEANYYDIFKIFQRNHFPRYAEIYKLMALVNLNDSYIADDVPF